MIGSQKVFELTSDDILRGMSSSEFIQDGGFSPLTEGINPTKQPGLIYFSAEKVDQTDDLTDDLIASCEDGTLGTSAVDRIFVDDAGKYYDWDGTTLDNIATDGGTPNGGYAKGNTQMISFGITNNRANIFTTNGQYITRLELSSDTLTATFKQFTFNASSASLVAPHPCIVFENNAFYGDGNLLRRQTSATDTTVGVIMTLPTEQIIVSFGIDPGTGYLLISTVEGPNASDTKNRICRVHYHDGFSNKSVKTIIVDDMITAFYPVGAVMYIGYGQNLGIWDGQGIRFLRKLNVSLNSTKLPYRDNFTNIGSTLYVIEANKILAYGPVIGSSPPIFYYAFVNKDGNLVAGDLTCITNLGSGLLGFGWVDASAVEKFATLDTTSVSTLTNNFVKFYTNKYQFPTSITFNSVVIEYGVALPTSSAYADIYIGHIASNSSLKYGIDTTTQIAVAATNTVSNVLEMAYGFPSITTRSFYLRFDAAQVVAIERMTFFNNSYD